MSKKGHQICRAHADLPFVYCRNCGAWGHRRTKKLTSMCGPPAASGVQALSRIRGGLHPLQRRGPMGILMPREKIRTVARFCGESGVWERIDYDGGDDPKPGSAAEEVATAGTGDGAAEARSGGGDRVIDAVPSHVRDESIDAEAVELMIEDDDRRMFDERSDEEDVFGHGGSLCEVNGGESKQLTQSTEEGGCAAAASSSGEGRKFQGGSVKQPAEATSGSRRGMKSIREATAHGSTSAAVVRMMTGSRPSNVNAAAKLREIRQRVLARCRGGLRREDADLDGGGSGQC